MAAKAWQPSFLDEMVAQAGSSPPLAGMPGVKMSTGGQDFRAMPIESPQPEPPPPKTDWADVAGAGIGAAGATVGTLAQLAGQKFAWDQQALQNNAYLDLSEKLAKMRLGQQQNQFDIAQAFNALQWALQANKAYQNTGVGGRELRRTSSDLLGDALRRLYLPTRR